MTNGNDFKKRRRSLLAWALCAAIILGNLPISENSKMLVHAEESEEAEETLLLEEEAETEIVFGMEDDLTEEDIVEEEVSVSEETKIHTTVSEEDAESADFEEDIEMNVENTDSGSAVNEASEEADSETDTRENIAEGVYGDITWVIDADGKLTVEGTGEFSETIKNDRAPWYNKRKKIESVEVNVTGLKDASYMFYGCSSLINLDLSNFDTRCVTNMEGMFYGCSSLANLDLSNFDTRCVTNMSNMFGGDWISLVSSSNYKNSCSSLTSLDLTSFDTRCVTDMSCMFYGCSSLTSLDLTSFDTHCVTDMCGMFSGCSSLTSLDLTSFDTRCVIDMVVMFKDCNSLTSLDLTSFDTSCLTDMYLMFKDCSNLTSLDLTSFDTRCVTNMEWLFYGCNNLSRLDLSSFDLSNTECTDDMFMFEQCNNLTIIYTPYNISENSNIPLPVSNNTDVWYDINGKTYTELPEGLDYSIVLTKHILPKVPDNPLTVSLMKTSYRKGSVLKPENLKVHYYTTDGKIVTLKPKGTNGNGYTLSDVDMNTLGKKTLTVSYNDGAQTYRTDLAFTVVESFPVLASGEYENITWSIEEDGTLFVNGTGEFSQEEGSDRAPWYDKRHFIKFAEINVTGMKNAFCMFYECNNLTNVDLSGFDTSNVTDMSEMFEGCSSLSSLDLGSFNTSNVTDMYCMFEGCSSLSSLDLGSFDTSNVTDIFYMFRGCSSLSSLNLDSFDTSNVTDMSYMFKGCSSLSSLNLDSFDTSNVTNMVAMFRDCSSLSSLNLDSFDTSNVRDMVDMFSDCSSLSSLNLDSFDTSNVRDMSSMFSGCNSLSSLNLDSFDTSNVTYMGSMFSGCNSLSSLNLDSFDTSNVTYMDEMFEGCSSLSSLNLDSFDTSNVRDMSSMFSGCNSLSSLSLGSFDTSNVTNMSSMFSGCNGLSTLDLSNFDIRIRRVINTMNMFYQCNNLTIIYTPYKYEISANSNENCNITLPVSNDNDVWYDINGNTYTKLPKGLDYSIVLAKNVLPKVPDNQLTVSLMKTTYLKGSALKPEDVKVQYHTTDGKVVTLKPKGTSENGYTLSDVDMNTVGTKTLIVSYYDGVKTLTQTVNFTVVSESTKPTEPENPEENNSESEGSNESEASGESGNTNESESSIENSSESEASSEGNSEAESSSENSNESESSSEPSDNIGLRVTFPYGKTYTYTGSTINPVIAVTNNGKTLTENTDYTVKYSNNIKAGTAKLTVTGKGCFSGIQDTVFTIQPKSLRDNDITAKDITLAVNSKAAPVVVYNGVKLGTNDYTLSNTGKITKSGTLTITGKGNYKDSVTINMNVVETLGKFKVNMAKDKLTYNGSAQKLGFEVIDSKTKEPLKDEDYLAVYSKDLINAGTVKVTVIGLGSYGGSVTKSYKIAPAKENMTLTFDKTKEYVFDSTGVTVDDMKVKTEQGALLTYGKDYKVSYATAKAGTGKINVTFLGNYKGNKKITDTFTILPTVLNNSSVNVIVPDKVYTGKKNAYKSVPIVTDKNRNTIKNSNYTVTYYADQEMTKEITNKENLIELAESENAAVIYVKVIGKGNYAGNPNAYAQGQYNVKRTTASLLDISKATVTFKSGNTIVKKLEYTGLPLKPDLQVTIKGKDGKMITLDANQYTVKWIGNQNKGKATAVITGNGTEVNGYAFVGSKNASINITAENVNSVKNLFGK